MSTVHQPQQSVQPDPSRWAAFDAAWTPFDPALFAAGLQRAIDREQATPPPHVNTHDNFIAAFIAAGFPDPFAGHGDEPDYSDDCDWDSPGAPIGDGLDRSSWPTDAGEPECETIPAPYRPSLDEELAIALGLTYDLPGLIAAWADRLRLDHAPAWLVGRVRALADTARFLGATTFDEFDVREAILEENREESCRAGGRDDDQPLW